MTFPLSSLPFIAGSLREFLSNDRGKDTPIENEAALNSSSRLCDVLSSINDHERIRAYHLSRGEESNAMPVLHGKNNFAQVSKNLGTRAQVRK